MVWSVPSEFVKDARNGVPGEVSILQKYQLVIGGLLFVHCPIVGVAMPDLGAGGCELGCMMHGLPCPLVCSGERHRESMSIVTTLFLLAFALGGIGVGLYYAGVSESWSYVAFMTCCVAYFLVTNRMSRQV